jgi:hypothetical protein
MSQRKWYDSSSLSVSSIAKMYLQFGVGQCKNFVEEGNTKSIGVLMEFVLFPDDGVLKLETNESSPICWKRSICSFDSNTSKSSVISCRQVESGH